MVAKFDARWLPRTFLVLLESLLNKTPSMRPTCERVTEAIRKGKVDLPHLLHSQSSNPFRQFDPIRETPTENLPLAMVVNSSPQGAYFTPEDEILPRETVVSEKLILSVPSPTEVSGSEDRLLQSWFNWGTFNILLDTNQGRRWAEMMMKFIRSLLLIVKVMTLRGMWDRKSVV